jgi:hypothetical protein
VTPADYVDHLGLHLIDALSAAPAADLSAVLTQAIEATARELDLRPGDSPSSTATIVRLRGPWLDVLVLGDSPAILPEQVVTDDRISRLPLAARAEFVSRLGSGGGYDDAHRETLVRLQEQEALRRNKSDGYWIAEADPRAAEHAILITRQRADIPWCVIATDGAYDPIAHLGVYTWDTIAQFDNDQLAELLQLCDRWEHDVDPDGRALPRAKRHDDKTLTVLHF